MIARGCDFAKGRCSVHRSLCIVASTAISHRCHVGWRFEPRARQCSNQADHVHATLLQGAVERTLKSVPRITAKAMDHLMQRYHMFDDLAAASIADLQDVPGVGKVLASRIKDATRDKSPAGASRPSLKQVSEQPVSTQQKVQAWAVVEEMRDLRQRLTKERETLQALSAAYYEGAPDTPDATFDALKAAYERDVSTASQHGGSADLSLADAVGAPVAAGAKAEHSAARGGRLLSLAAVHSADEVRTWWQRNVEAHLGEGGLQAVEVAVEPKVDGLTLRASYEDGACVQAATRGDGFVGEDVTHNVPAIAGLPQRTPSGRHSHSTPFTVRGEVYISHGDFEALNRERGERGLEPFSNARNAAAGSLRLPDPAKAADRRLRFVAFECMAGAIPEGKGASVFGPRHTDAMHVLGNMGFETLAAHSRVAHGVEAAISAAEEMMASRGELPFQADGFVIKLNRFLDQQALGTNNTDPKWAIAWKPAAEVAVTQLREITISVGRSGIIVPVAVVEPVDIAGVTITRASLHNTHHAQRLGLHVGDSVVLERRGDVIPQVADVLPQRRPRGASQWRPPQRCPACNARLTLRAVDTKGAVQMLECGSAACSGRRERTLEHFAASCFKGVGARLVQTLVEEGLCRRPDDFYRLREHQAAMEQWKGFGPKKVGNMLDAIEKSKAQPAHVLLAGLGIPAVGQRMAKVLLSHCGGSVTGLSRKTVDDLVEIKGISQITARRVVDWFDSAENQDLAASLAATWGCGEGAVAAQQHSEPDGGAAAVAGEALRVGGVELMPGDSIVATGTVPGANRAQIEAWAGRHGLRLASNVSSNTKLLIQGSARGTSRKRQKAGELQVAVVETGDDLAELVALMGEHG